MVFTERFPEPTASPTQVRREAGRQGRQAVRDTSAADQYRRRSAGSRRALPGRFTRRPLRCRKLCARQRTDRRRRPPLLSGAIPDRRRQDGQVRRLERLRRPRHELLRCDQHAGGQLAQQYTMADNFFHAAFGGSFLDRSMAGLRRDADLAQRAEGQWSRSSMRTA